jgi:hypothetical protein
MAYLPDHAEYRDGMWERQVKQCPSAAQSEPFEAGKPIRIILLYSNTGRVPAFSNFVDGGQFFSPQQWKDGTASQLLKSNEEQCMSGLTNIGENQIIRGVAYPTTGLLSIYRMFYDSSNTNITNENDKVVISNQTIAEHQIYLYYGCFVYQTGGGAPHHSFFCFFYQPSVSDIKGLPYCQFGQRAD